MIRRSSSFYITYNSQHVFCIAGIYATTQVFSLADIFFIAALINTFVGYECRDPLQPQLPSTHENMYCFYHAFICAASTSWHDDSKTARLAVAILSFSATCWRSQRCFGTDLRSLGGNLWPDAQSLRYLRGCMSCSQ